MVQTTQLTHRVVKERMVKAMGGKCNVCGYDQCLSALEFHHVDPREKKYNFSQMVHKRFSWASIVRELRKAALVCSNCHKEINEGLARLPANYKRFDESYASDNW